MGESMSGGSRSESESEGDDVLSPIVARAAASMRAEVPVRAEWRAEVLEELRDEAERPVRLVASSEHEQYTATGDVALPRGWNISPRSAIAAGLVLFALGAGSAAFVLSRGSDPSALAVPNAATSAAAGVTAVTMAANGATLGSNAGSTVRFMIVAPAASRVSLVGDFNLWNPRATPMHRLEDGRTWVADVPLDAGRHVYAFVVDGGLTTDPAAPRAAEDDFGVPSSVVMVSRRAS